MLMKFWNFLYNTYNTNIKVFYGKCSNFLTESMYFVRIENLELGHLERVANYQSECPACICG